MENIVFGSKVRVEVAKGDFRVGTFCNYSGKGNGAWVDFPDTPELSDFYPMFAIKAHVDEEPVMMLTNCPGCGDEMQVAMVDGVIPGKACHDCAMEVTDNNQEKHDLAKAILTVLDSDDGAVNRLVAIRAICNNVINTDDTDNKIILMNPHQVVIHTQPTERDIRTQMKRLRREGQIEPILLKPDNSPDRTDWLYADAVVIAAQRLEWPTILVTYDNKDNG